MTEQDLARATLSSHLAEERHCLCNAEVPGRTELVAPRFCTCYGGKTKAEVVVPRWRRSL